MATRWQVTKAVRASDLPAPSRLVMLTLADVAEVGTAEIPAKWTPSLKVLAGETGLNESTVTRHLAALERGGWVVRTRPDPIDARMNAERTRYRLTLPSGVGAEDIPEGAESTHPHAEDTQTPMQEAPSPGCTEHPIKEEVRSSSDQVRSSSDQSPPPASEVLDAVIVETTNLPAVVSIPNAGQLTRAWIDHCSTNGVKLPTSTIKRYGKHIGDAMKQGFDPNLIKRALAQMLADGEASRPSYFDNYLVRAQSGPARGPRKLTPGEASVARLARDPEVQAGIADMLANYGPKAEPA